MWSCAPTKAMTQGEFELLFPPRTHLRSTDPDQVSHRRLEGSRKRGSRPRLPSLGTQHSEELTRMWSCAPTKAMTQGEFELLFPPRTHLRSTDPDQVSHWRLEGSRWRESRPRLLSLGTQHSEEVGRMWSGATLAACLSGPDTR
jgi:hypothetical protein